MTGDWTGADDTAEHSEVDRAVIGHRLVRHGEHGPQVMAVLLRVWVDGQPDPIRLKLSVPAAEQLGAAIRKSARKAARE